MGFLVNKTTKMIHDEECYFVKEHYKKTKSKKNCKYESFKTKEAAKNYFIRQDKEYSYCKFCCK